MLQNCKGFSLLEMFLALTIWSLLTLFFIPAYTHLLKQYQQLDQELTSTQLLYEYLMQFRVEEKEKKGMEVEKNGTRYSIKWIREEEVCLYYENVFQKKQQICENVQ
ncbi:competence type IV pilus minor pilin ComGE [Niallia sp. 01092]|uniref:competence type IV pilus minor pilin ComGE n=1 Tax=unclassified Niallia TaxID=2837522 RepID=UPI003FD4E4DD